MFLISLKCQQFNSSLLTTQEHSWKWVATPQQELPEQWLDKSLLRRFLLMGDNHFNIGLLHCDLPGIVKAVVFKKLNSFEKDLKLVTL